MSRLTEWLVRRQACLSLTSLLIIAHARAVWLHPGCCSPTDSGSHLYHRGECFWSSTSFTCSFSSGRLKQADLTESVQQLMQFVFFLVKQADIEHFKDWSNSVLLSTNPTKVQKLFHLLILPNFPIWPVAHSLKISTDKISTDISFKGTFHFVRLVTALCEVTKLKLHEAKYPQRRLLD